MCCEIRLCKLDKVQSQAFRALRGINGHPHFIVCAPARHGCVKGVRNRRTQALDTVELRQGGREDGFIWIRELDKAGLGERGVRQARVR